MARRADPKPYRRADGMYRLDVQLGHGSRGHRKRRSLYGSSPDEVLDKVDELRRRQRIGLGPIDERLTVATYLASWADGLTGLRPRTLESYRFTVDRHLIPILGTLSLLHLTAADIRRAVRVIQEGKPDPKRGGRHTGGTRTAAYAVTVLRIALGVAVRDRILERNVAGDVRRPTSSAPERDYLGAEDARKLLDQVKGDRLEAMYVVTLATGLRRGEVTGLGWKDVDLEAGTIRISRSLSYRPGDAYELGAPKTTKSRRTIRLPAIAAEALRAHKQRQREERIGAGGRWRKDWAETELVFTTSVGGPLASSTTSHALHRHLAAAGLPRQRFHDLRHAAASILVEAGIDQPFVQELLGHTDLATTRRYSHVRPTSSVTAEAMDRALGGRPDVDEAAR